MNVLESENLLWFDYRVRYKAGEGRRGLIIFRLFLRVSSLF